MGKVHVLDESTINQIAAGEVIDRPSSVVKELVENAIDAGASAVTIEIKEGGLSLIRISDNGSGIDKDDIQNAFKAHATSKIRDAADLVSVSSLGFRGEALSSIAAVCRVELITKTRDSITGVSYKIEGGKEISMEEIGAPDGTTFLVRDIFYNTPARRKFLKTAHTEGLYISELVERMALSKPEISFRLIINGQNKLYTSGNGKLKDCIYTVFGKEIASNLIPIKLKLSGLNVTGFVGKPVISRGNRSFENYFVNGRYIKSKVISRSIEDAYKPYMMQHKYPFTVLLIDIPSDLLDVNVHPAKMELRFRQEDVLYQEIYKVISSTVGAQDLVVEAHIGSDKENRVAENITYTTKKEAKPVRNPEPFEPLRTLSETAKRNENWGFVKEPVDEIVGEMVKKETAVDRQMEEAISRMASAEDMEKMAKQYLTDISSTEVRPESNELAPEQVTEVSQLELFDDRLLSKNARSKHRLIGQLFETYWMVEYEDKLFIIDQHAAHEKVLFERTMKNLDSHEGTSQMLAPSIILNLTRRQSATLSENIEYFTRLGFEISDLGDDSYSVNAIPSNLFSLNQVDLLVEIIDDLSDELKSNNVNQTILDKVASMSCKAAVKGNTKLTSSEADALIDELLTLDNPYACPHGRPTIISMSKYEIEKKFKRVL